MQDAVFFCTLWIPLKRLLKETLYFLCRKNHHTTFLHLRRFARRLACSTSTLGNCWKTINTPALSTWPCSVPWKSNGNRRATSRSRYVCCTTPTRSGNRCRTTFRMRCPKKMMVLPHLPHLVVCWKYFCSCLFIHISFRIFNFIELLWIRIASLL